MIDRAACAEPVSWLALERHALGELDPARAASVSAHLVGCAACRAVLDQIEGDRRALPPLAELALARARRRRRTGRALAAGSALVLAAAAFLLVVRERRGDPPGIASIKGGELAVGLVRERAGDVVHDPTSFRPGDRFKVLVTCAVAGPVSAEVSVDQDGSIDRLPAAPIQCGNQVPLPGAFRITGSGPASICVEVAGRRQCRALTPE